MKRLMLLSTALIFSATMAFATITADELVAAYQADGYTKIEVKTGLTQIKVRPSWARPRSRSSMTLRPVRS